MHRRVPREPGERLDPLTLARDRPAAGLLVGGHDHVNESLEEIALRRLTGTPRFFERFVRFEERSGPRQGKAPLV
jgi:hypothetical protein